MNNFYRSLTQCNRFILIIPIILSIAGILTIAGISCNAGTFPSREVIIQSAALLAGIIMITLIMKLGCRYFTDLEWFIYIISVFFSPFGIHPRCRNNVLRLTCLARYRFYNNPAFRICKNFLCHRHGFISHTAQRFTAEHIRSA